MSTSYNNNTADQEIAQLKKQIADGTENTKSYLTQLQTKIADYDKEHQLSDTASSYLQAGIDKANWSLEELKDFGARFKDGSKDLSDDIIKSGKSALANLQSSLESLKSQASEYDAKASKNANNASHEASKTASNAKYEAEKGASNAKHEVQKQASNAKSTLSDLVGSTGDSKSANNASHEASKKASNAKYEVEKGASNAKHEVQKEASNAKSTLSDLFDSARDQGNSWFDSLSASFENLQKQISANAAAAGNAISNAAQTTTDKIAETDKNVTGGVGADLYNKTADLVNQGVDYVSSTLQSTPTDKTSTSIKP